jgi:hypothetical protein
MLNRQTANRDKDYCIEGISCVVDVPLMPGGDILQENQTSTNYRYTTNLAILQISNKCFIHSPTDNQAEIIVFV